MHFIIHFIIFISIFIIYCHCLNQTTIKFFNNVYQINFINNENLQNTCSLFKPFVFEYNDYNISECVNFLQNNNFFKYNVFNMSDKKITTLSYKKFNKFIENNNNNFYSYNNFFNISLLDNYSIKNITNDFVPPFSTFTKFDLIMGSSNSYTPLLSHKNYSCFFILLSGKAKSIVINNTIQNKYNFDKDSIWEKKSSNNIKIKLIKNTVLYMPPYHYNSFNFLTNNTIILAIYFDTITSTGINFCKNFVKKINS